MIVAVDMGGTFTDAIAIDENGNIKYYKGLSTPRNPEVGLRKAIEELNVKVDRVIHATTVATNAFLGQLNLELPKTALITTKGFKDIIEIGRQNRPELYDMYFHKPKPLVPRELRFEVNERTLFDGKVLVKLNPLEIDEIAVRLKDVESVAVSFLHSYANPENEDVAKEVLSKHFNYVCISHEVCPEQREYERTSTTVINAMLMPIVSRYLESISKDIPSLYIMSSSGGLVDVDEVKKRPVQIIESGPAAGVVGAQVFSQLLGISNVISFDMGGTTAKAGSIVNNEIEITSEYEVGGKAHHGRLVKGSGYPVRFPFIDLAEVSAGGGTIIWRDEGGALRVGPISAGADPGPIAYMKGGDKPTLTDANLVLGRINEYLLSGNMRLDVEGARSGLEKLGDPIEVSYQAVKLASIEMARAIRLVTVERGLDPTEFTLFAFGGAGPQWAVDVAEELGIKRIIVPPHPGLFSALSLLAVDEKIEARSPFPRDVDSEFRKLEESLRRRMGTVDYFIRYVDARYKGQGWELTVLVKNDYRRDFEERHRAVYGYTLPYPIEVVNARVFAVRKTVKPVLPDPVGGNINKKIRKVYIDDWVSADIYLREKLPKGFRAKGPVIVEEYSSTTLVKDGWELEVGKMGFMEVRKQ
ncbi:hydantoinase/oxoprolinase family protein [Sulfolobus acidocaldarius]|uniref:hydantoinase/oxoprolinase family protein n=1 Tax=Sulfolobus acidocaldarius TaxID=2285 RepID=UPI0007812AA4|nr:hydantoinase/oxoprolinase family protein [Sulfolobus acidocaldarius]